MISSRGFADSLSGLPVIFSAKAVYVSETFLACGSISSIVKSDSQSVASSGDLWPVSRARVVT